MPRVTTYDLGSGQGMRSPLLAKRCTGDMRPQLVEYNLTRHSLPSPTNMIISVFHSWTGLCRDICIPVEGPQGHRTPH
jgi:hypothetical protein